MDDNGGAAHGNDGGRRGLIHRVRTPHPPIQPVPPAHREQQPGRRKHVPVERFLHGCPHKSHV